MPVSKSVRKVYSELIKTRPGSPSLRVAPPQFVIMALALTETSGLEWEVGINSGVVTLRKVIRRRGKGSDRVDAAQVADLSLPVRGSE